MLCTMEAHVKHVLFCSDNAVEPTAVFSDLRRIGEHFCFGRQEDAHEFLCYTVAAMQTACLNGSTSLDTSSQATTVIHQIFGGFLRSRVTCLSCQAVSESYEAFLDIPLEKQKLPFALLQKDKRDEETQLWVVQLMNPEVTQSLEKSTFASQSGICVILFS
ncbi:ubiquitin carboxyl-terminal hydrolase 36-like [Dromaius novaehollandiae]